MLTSCRYLLRLSKLPHPTLGNKNGPHIYSTKNVDLTQQFSPTRFGKNGPLTEKQYSEMGFKTKGGGKHTAAQLMFEHVVPGTGRQWEDGPDPKKLGAAVARQICGLDKTLPQCAGGGGKAAPSGGDEGAAPAASSSSASSVLQKKRKNRYGVWNKHVLVL